MRQHLEHLAAALGLLVFALFVSYFHTGNEFSAHKDVAALTPLKEAATTTPSFTFSTTTLENLFRNASATSAAPAASTSSSAKSPVQAKATPPVLVTPRPQSAPVASIPTSSSPVPVTEASRLKASVVNIFCVSHTPALHSVSGSGVLIDSRGIILTVAHVAQVLLLEQYLGSDKVSCTIRTGSPAKNTYLAHPIYVSEAWLKENPTTLISSQPTGTGEHDYALLAITSSAIGGPLPGAFPALAIGATVPEKGASLSLGSYGAQDLTTAQVWNALSPTFDESTVSDRYTFDTTTADVLSIAGNATAEEGSSGGAVTDSDGALVGLITTSETTGSLSSRHMRAITLDYIERSYTNDTGRNFGSYFGDTSITTLVAGYAPTAQSQGEELAHDIGLTQ